LRKKSAFLIQTTDSGRYFREHHAYSQMIAATHLLQCNGGLSAAPKPASPRFATLTMKQCRSPQKKKRNQTVALKST